MEDFESVLKKDAPTPAFIPEGLSFDALIKNETAVVSRLINSIHAEAI